MGGEVLVRRIMMIVILSRTSPGDYVPKWLLFCAAVIDSTVVLSVVIVCQNLDKVLG